MSVRFVRAPSWGVFMIRSSLWWSVLGPHHIMSRLFFFPLQIEGQEHIFRRGCRCIDSDSTVPPHQYVERGLERNGGGLPEIRETGFRDGGLKSQKMRSLEHTRPPSDCKRAIPTGIPTLTQKYNLQQARTRRPRLMRKSLHDSLISQDLLNDPVLELGPLDKVSADFTASAQAFKLFNSVRCGAHCRILRCHSDCPLL